MPPLQHSPRPRRRRDAGFTIADVMISTLVLAFVIMTSLTLVQYGIRATDNARSTTIAGQIAQSVMEDTRMLPWSTVSTLASGAVTIGESFTANNSAAAALVNRFTITRTLSDVTTTMKRIDVTAAWTGIDGRPHSLKYTSYYGQNGLHDYYVK